MSTLLDDPIWGQLLLASANSTKAFASTFMQERFNRPFASITDQIFAAIDGPDQKVLIKAPRGWGKTTINSIGLPARHICFRKSKFIVPISCTATKAELEADNLKFELTTNPLITNVFPDLKTELWAKDKFLVGDTYVMPRGAGQQIRGINFRGQRPDLIIVDDLEDPEHVTSEDQRKKLSEWFAADVENSIDRASNDWKIIVVGTVLHEDSLLMQLSKKPGWKTVTIELCDDNLKSNWPDFLSDEQVEALFEEFRSDGKADVFAREYQNRPISSLDATFRSSYFQNYEPTDILDNRGITYMTIVDPAKSVQLHTADSAVVTVGIDRDKHKIFFHDCTAGKMYPDQLYDAMFEHITHHGSRILAIEVTSLHEFIVQPVKNEMRRRGVFVTLIELAARAKKEERIAQLAPYYRQGLIWHNPKVSAKLELQLTSFPRSALWDVMDAFAYTIELLELDEHYFTPPDDDSDPEKEFAELQDEDGPMKYARVL